MTNVIYYTTEAHSNPVNDFLDSLLPNQQTKLLRIVAYIKQYGLASVLPHVRKITGIPLWEIRILGKDNIRVIYICEQEGRVLLLHGFIKKTQKTPAKDIEIALLRYNDWLKRSLGLLLD